MSSRISRGLKSAFTFANVVMLLIGAFSVIISAVTARWINNLEAGIPTRIENEVNRKLPEAVKIEVPKAVKEQLTAQIYEKIESEIKDRADKTEVELFRRQDAHQQAINDRIQTIWEMVAANKKALGSALKTSVSGNKIAVMRKLPEGLQLLEHATLKALNAPSREAVPTISQQDFNLIAKYIFREYPDPYLNTELWKAVLEFSKYKTIVNGVEFGLPRKNKYSGYNVYIGDEDQDFSNAIFYDSHIVLRNDCPLNLQNVRFVNCTFEVDDAPNGRLLLNKLMTSPDPKITLMVKPPPGYVKGACQK